jgi:hypothetical protein
MNLYETYLNTKSSGSVEDRIEVMNDIIRQNPKLMDYIETKIDSCYGTHIVYLVNMRVNGEDMLKIGYTKNSVDGRFGEHRYAGRDSLEIVEKIREEKLQAKGAIEFEKSLKEKFKDFKITTDLTLPGKGEFYDIVFYDEMIRVYDEEYPKFINVIGLKSPN